MLIGADPIRPWPAPFVEARTRLDRTCSCDDDGLTRICSSDGWQRKPRVLEYVVHFAVHGDEDCARCMRQALGSPDPGRLDTDTLLPACFAACMNPTKLNIVFLVSQFPGKLRPKPTTPPAQVRLSQRSRCHALSVHAR